MKSLKAIFAFFVPLLAMLITFCIFLLIDNIVDNYKNKISRDYSIVLVATNPIKKESLNELAGIKVENIQLLPNEKIIENIKSNLSDNSIELLRQKLPYFYQIYLLLLILNSVSFILFFIITIFAIIIIAKQIKLWFHEHSVRISILRLHGASIIYSASSVLKYALISSFLAFLISSLFLIYVSSNIEVLFPFELQEIVNVNINIERDILKIFILSFCISVFTIFGVLFKYKISND